MSSRSRLPLRVLATLALAANLAAQSTGSPPPESAAAAPAATNPAAPAIADEIVELEPLDVVATREEGYVATRSSVGTRTGAPIAETPQSVSIITAGLIRDQNAQNIQEVLRYSAGVRAEMYGLDNRGDWFALRGGSEGSTLLNGLRLPLSGYWGNVRNEPFAFEQVEVLRGPSSVMAGQNGPGGVINLVSKTPQARRQGEVSFQVGNHETVQGTVDVTGPANDSGTVLYRVLGLVRDGETQVDNTKDERRFLAPSLTWKPNERTTLTVLAEYQHDWSNNNVGFFPWVGMIFPAPNGPIPDTTFIGEPSFDKYEGTRHRIGYNLENKLNDTWTLSHGARFDHVEGNLAGMYANFWEGGFLPDGRSVNRTWYADRTTTEVANADLKAIGRFEGERIEHTVLLAFDYLWSENGVGGTGGAATPLDVYTPAYGSFSLPENLVYGPEDNVRSDQFGFTVQDQIKVDKRFVFVPGLRYDVARADASGAGYDTDALTGRFGVVWLAPRGLSPYVSYSESFEANGGTDADGDAFDPRRGDQIELGLKWTSPDERFTAGTAVYELHETNRLTTDPLDPLNSVPQGEVTVRGFELEAAANLRVWQLTANYTYTDAQVTDSSTPGDASLDQQLQGIPLHSAAAWVVYKFADLGLPGLRTGLGLRYVGESEDGTGNPLLETPSNTLWDGLVSYERGAWTYSVNASNLFDKEYIATSLSRGDSWFGVRRKVSATVSYRW